MSKYVKSILVHKAVYKKFRFPMSYSLIAYRKPQKQSIVGSREKILKEKVKWLHNYSKYRTMKDWYHWNKIAFYDWKSRIGSIKDKLSQYGRIIKVYE